MLVRSDTVSTVARVMAGVTFLIGIAAATGWAFGIDALKSIVPGTVNMKINTAICLAAIGVALWSTGTGPALSARGRLATWASLATVVAIAGLTMVQFIAGVDLGIDQLLAREAPGAIGTTIAGRMSPQTALSLLSISLALVLVNMTRGGSVVVVLALAPLMLGALSLMDRLYGATAPTFLAAYTQMAVPTSVAFIALGLGTMAALPQGGPLAALVGRSPAASSGRGLLAVAIVVPTAMGWLRLEGQRLGLYDTAYGVSITTALFIGLFVFAIWQVMGLVARADLRRSQAFGVTESALAEAQAAQAAAVVARARAEEADRAKSEFLSRMSHELRTPLNAILGFAQLMEMDGVEGEQRASVRQISRAGRHLLELINEVLDIARIEAGPSISPEPVAVAGLVTEALELLAPAAGARRVSLSADATSGDLHVLADRRRLKQVLLNLLSNAIKYGPVGGRVEVHYEIRKGEDQALRIRVTDDGPGIPLEKRDRLFSPFERLGAERTSVEGAGMGLAVSRGLAEAMGGRIGLEAAAGRGSSFWVELGIVEGPLQANDESLSALPSPSPSLGRRTVLYIEDDLSNV